MNERRYIELVVYHLSHKGRTTQIDAFLEQAALPAYNRLGISPVGVFTGLYGPASASIYLLLPHPNLKSVVTARDRLLEDRDYIKAAGAYLDAPIDNPFYLRYESTLMAAFSAMPQVELPEGQLEKPARIEEDRDVQRGR